MITLLTKLKHGVVLVFLFLIAFLGATVLVLRGQNQKAKETIKTVKRDLTISETLRETEQIMKEAINKTRSQANEAEHVRQERKANDDRPTKFGDPRLHQRSRNSTSKNDS